MVTGHSLECPLNKECLPIARGTYSSSKGTAAAKIVVLPQPKCRARGVDGCTSTSPQACTMPTPGLPKTSVHTPSPCCARTSASPRFCGWGRHCVAPCEAPAHPPPLRPRRRERPHRSHLRPAHVESTQSMVDQYTEHGRQTHCEHTANPAVSTQHIHCEHTEHGQRARMGLTVERGPVQGRVPPLTLSSTGLPTASRRHAQVTVHT